VSEQKPLFPEPMPPLGGAEQPKAKPPVPKEVNIAFGVWLLSIVLSLVLQLLDTNGFVEAYQKQIAGTPQDGVLGGGQLKVIYIVGVVVVSGLMLLFAWKMRSGRNWARVVLAVLAVIGLMFQAQSVGIGVVALIGVLITAVGLVFMFVPASNAYFAQFRRPPVRR
jgi:hypothetical protein